MKENTNRHTADWQNQSCQKHMLSLTCLMVLHPVIQIPFVLMQWKQRPGFVHLIFRFKCKENVHFFFFLIQILFHGCLCILKISSSLQHRKKILKHCSEYSVFLLWHMHCTLSQHRRESPLCFEKEVEFTCVQKLFYAAILRVIILVLHKQRFQQSYR